MASTSQSATQLLRGPGKLFLQTYGTFPNEAVGYTVDGVKIKIDATYEEDTADEVLEPIASAMTSRRTTISGNLKQVNVDLLSRILGITASTTNLALTGDPEELENSLLFDMTRADGCPVILYLPRAKSDGNLELDIKRGSGVSLPFSFKSLYASGGFLRTGPAAVQTATLSTNTFARTNAAPSANIAWYSISGESAAADTLTDITGGTTLVDGELIRIQISAITMPITIVHGSGVIETSTSADFILTKLADWIDLRYDLANTKWIEVARHDAA